MITSWNKFWQFAEMVLKSNLFKYSKERTTQKLKKSTFYSKIFWLVLFSSVILKFTKRFCITLLKIKIK